MITVVEPVIGSGVVMNLHVILVAGLVLCVTGCAEKEQVMSEPGDEAPMTAPEVVAPTGGNEIWQNLSFRKHMHLHAEKLDDLNYALADDDLDAAMTPARWLSDHDTDTDIQSDWLPYLYGMRTEAKAIESATDLTTARAAAERISAQCQTCHAAVGINIQ